MGLCYQWTTWLVITCTATQLEFTACSPNGSKPAKKQRLTHQYESVTQGSGENKKSSQRCLSVMVGGDKKGTVNSKSKGCEELNINDTGGTRGDTERCAASEQLSVTD